MDNKPPIDLDAEPDPMLARQQDASNVNMPGKSKRFFSILIGFLVVVLLIALFLVAIYVLRAHMPEMIQEYLPEDVEIPYLDSRD